MGGEGSIRVSVARDIGIPGAIDGNTIPMLIITPAEVGGVGKRLASTIQLGDKDVKPPGITLLKRILGWEVERGSISRNISIPRAIYGNTIAIIIITSAQIGGIDEGITIAVKFGHKDIPITGFTALIWILDREISRGSVSCHISVPFTIHRNVLAIIIISAAQIGGVAGVENQPEVWVIISYCKTNLFFSSQTKCDVNLLSAAINFLISDRRGISHLTPCRLDNQGAGRRIYRNTFDTLVKHPDLFRFRMGLKIKSVFQSPLIAAVYEVNSRVYTAIDYFAAGWDVRLPGRWVIADKIVDSSPQFSLRFRHDTSVFRKPQTDTPLGEPKY